jgi:hypothetical protein
VTHRQETDHGDGNIFAEHEKGFAISY